ncbi:MAG: DUF1684 domain-containing protein [Bacteroidota bacterium]|nr:DUF1684 domain-containing protein [Bacteroidota bacterium]
MKSKNIIILVVAVVLIVTLFYSFQGSQDVTAFQKEIEKERQDKDRFMRTSDESPFENDPESYTGLKYFSPDVKYRIIADLAPITQKKSVILTTNDGLEQRYIEYAYAEFKLDGVANRLLILEIADGPLRGKLFLAFGDETSARETYGAGRYLDVPRTPGSNTITLDFNLAYNPYCAYNDSFSCPLPPRENILEVAIRAGEKNYHE